MERRKYRHPPIEEAVCDFHFAPGTEWDPATPWRIYEELKGTYNEKPTLQRVVEARLQGRPEGDASISMQPAAVMQRVQLRAENGTRIVSVGPDQLLVHMLRPYTTWEDFRPKISQALDVYKIVAQPEAVTRVGLRYINRITIADPAPKLELYFTVPPKFPDIGSPFKVRAFFNRKEAEFEDHPVRIVVTFADVETSSPGDSTYILDLDIIWITQDNPISLERLPDVLEILKTRHRQVFEALITDETRKLFDAD